MRWSPVPWLAAATLALLTSACTTPQASSIECQPTLERRRPPDRVLDFMMSGVSGTQTPPKELRERIARSYYGNEAIWLPLPDGGVVTKLDWKFPTFTLQSGTLRIEGRRIDAPAPPAAGSVAPGFIDVPVPPAPGFPDSAFQSTVVRFPTPGCWEVVYRLGDAALTFVVLVEPTDDP
jgi:hypothetical protein